MYKIRVMDPALDMFREINDLVTRSQIKSQRHRLKEAPKKIGSPLNYELNGLYSLRVGGQRYRLIYYVDEEEKAVYLLAVGIRREGSRSDIYARFKRMLERGIFDWLR